MDGLLTLSNELAAAVEHAGRAVFGINARPRLGSAGVHWRPGSIVTADHTVHVDEEITVTRPDGRVVTATVAGRDPAIDIAILKVDASDVPVAASGDSAAVRVGHIVLAVGPGPRGAGRGERDRRRAGRPECRRRSLQPRPDALSGFSGGPLVDVQGRVVGVNTSGSSRQLQLAIPAAAVNRVLDELLRRGRIPRAYLGVGTQQVRLPEALRQRLNLDQQTAVIVVDVQPNSPAAGAGLLIGDIILSLGGTSIEEPADLKASATRPGG